MNNSPHIQGVFAAAVTPLSSSFSIALDEFPPFLDFLAKRGCHGALLFGTTGEGPSFSVEARKSLMQAASIWRDSNPSFQLMAGVGTPSLDETIQLTRIAFESGMDAVLVLPPYYFRNVPDDGLYAWYHAIITKAVPEGSALLGYHIPRVTGVPLSLELLARLKDKFPDQFAGIKDSSADLETAKSLGNRFGKDLLVFNGTDPLFSDALDFQATGCITALANVLSPYLRKIWDAYLKNRQDADAQNKLRLVRSITDRYTPAPPMLKSLLSRCFMQPRWSVCPPLLPLSLEKETGLLTELDSLPFDWKE